MSLVVRLVALALPLSMQPCRGPQSQTPQLPLLVVKSVTNRPDEFSKLFIFFRLMTSAKIRQAYSSCCSKVGPPRTESYEEAEFAQVVHAEPGNAAAEGDSQHADEGLDHSRGSKPVLTTKINIIDQYG